MFANIENSFSWDSTAAKYMPLQIGNIWVYYGEYHAPSTPIGSSYIRFKITSILDTLGKKYYKFERTRVNITGNGAGSLNFLLLRIDSLTMNLYDPNPGCSGPESLYDSLRSKIHDSAKCQYTSRICKDTSYRSLFSMTFSCKEFTNDRWNRNSHYYRGIGLVRDEWGEAMVWGFDVLRGCVINGVLYGDTNFVVGINQISAEVPENFSLTQNFPNPFNPSTNIGFRIADFGMVRIVIYDALGREIQTLVNQELSPGTYEVDFNGSNLPSGVYYYMLETENYKESKRMVLVK